MSASGKSGNRNYEYHRGYTGTGTNSPASLQGAMARKRKLLEEKLCRERAEKLRREGK